MEYIRKYWIVITIVFGVSIFAKPVLFPLILGAIICYMGLAAIQFMKKLHSNGIECTGRIVSFEVSKKGSKTPIIEYAPIGSGHIIEQPSVYASSNLSVISPSEGMIDAEVVILYDPENPRKFILKEGKGLSYFASAFIILVGLVVISISIAILLGYIKLGWLTK